MKPLFSIRTGEPEIYFTLNLHSLFRIQLLQYQQKKIVLFELTVHRAFNWYRLQCCSHREHGHGFKNLNNDHKIKQTNFLTITTWKHEKFDYLAARGTYFALLSHSWQCLLYSIWKNNLLVGILAWTNLIKPTSIEHIFVANSWWSVKCQINKLFEAKMHWFWSKRQTGFGVQKSIWLV